MLAKTLAGLDWLATIPSGAGRPLCSSRARALRSRDPASTAPSHWEVK